MQRDYKIDWLRSFAIISVLAAHAELPTVIRELRIFDVCLLVFISGMSQQIAHRDRFSFKYLCTRTIKLILPIWSVMTVIYLGIKVYCCLNGLSALYGLKTYIYTLLLTNHGMGYTWIIKIYVLITIFAPWISRYSEKENHFNFTLKIILVCLLLQSAIFLYENFFLGMCIELVNAIIEEYILGGVAYLIVAALGIRFVQYPEYKTWIIFIAVISFIICQLFYGIFQPSLHKYPPDIYYISYGVLMSSLFYSVVPYKKSRVIEWFSKNSYDLYIFHLPMLYGLMILNMGNDRNAYFSMNLVRFILLLVSGLAIILVKNIILYAIKRRKIKKIRGYVK